MVNSISRDTTQHSAGFLRFWSASRRRHPVVGIPVGRIPVGRIPFNSIMTTPSPDAPQTAIIGAGLAGLTCAQELASAGHAVTVFDKGRRPGGRMSTRTPEGLSFDHGCQYFTATSSAFQNQVCDWQEAGVVADWTVPVMQWREGQLSPLSDKPKFVGQPEMQSVCRHLATGLDVRCGVEITRVQRHGDRWQLRMDEAAPPLSFDRLIVAIPPAQAARVLDGHWPLVGCADVEMSVCWTLMLERQSHPQDRSGRGARSADSADRTDGADSADSAIRLVDHPLSWVARNSSKPGRPAAECWVAQASPAWSLHHLEDTREQAATALLEELQTVIGPVDAKYVRAHRWRYALPVVRLADVATADVTPAGIPEAEGARYWHEQSLGLCGDWCGGDRVEAAWQSGRQLARMIVS